MKKGIVLLALVLWAAVGIRLVFALNPTDETTVAQTFNEISCRQKTGFFEAHGDLTGEYLSVNEQKDLLLQIAADAGMSQDCQVETANRDGKWITTLHHRSAAADTTMSIVTYEVEVEDGLIETRQFFTWQLTLSEYIEQLVAIRNEWEQLLKKYPVDCQYSMNFQAKFDGKLSQNQKTQLTDWLLSKLNAKQVQANREETLYTIYAYTGLIPDYEIIDEKAVNVNLAFTCDEDTNQTSLYLASPYMMEEY